MKAPSRDALLAAGALACAVMALREPRLVPLLTVGGWTARPPSAEATAAPEEPPAPTDATGAVRAEREAQAWRDAVADHAASGASGWPGSPSARAGASSGWATYSGDAPSRAAGTSSSREQDAPGHASARGGARAPRQEEALGASAAEPRPHTEDLAGASPGESGAPRARPGRADGTRPPARGVALGPAPREDDEEETSRGAPRASTRSARRSPLAWAFRPEPRARRAAHAATHPGRVRPLTLSRLLGKGALRPPDPTLSPADLSGLRGRPIPALRPPGTPLPERVAGAEKLEGFSPGPGLAACRRRTAHWDDAVRHEGGVRGLPVEGEWLWLKRESGRWWAPLGETAEVHLRHGPGWWTKRKGIWHLLHQGEPWFPRPADEWGETTLLHPPSGSRMVYSSYLSRVALLVPGDGAALYDARTGEMLARWKEEEMPRRRPRAPAAPSFL